MVHRNRKHNVVAHGTHDATWKRAQGHGHYGVSRANNIREQPRSLIQRENKGLVTNPVSRNARTTSGPFIPCTDVTMADRVEVVTIGDGALGVSVDTNLVCLAASRSSIDNLSLAAVSSGRGGSPNGW